ncbi:helix-turn-helix domain-containing protein [Roseiconus lacunae]|uniref:helix-turn-helix domain-containing protein n=1 Tax=Roseiconus lacunae TaxID=2605694 RepID=UPI001E2A009B|nr:helix-turn-helix domain-containing protein [Roseiconus lacunae]MCD0463071.1 helix-turn-helix domain-containing protein [Roseiconus lacunae]
MPKKTDDEWLPDSRGRYRRKVGFWVNKNGRREQYRFSFGDNLNKAKARLARVRELWAHVEELSRQSKPVRFHPLPSDLDPIEPDPLWTAESLLIARQLSAGDVQIVVGSSWTQTPESYAAQIHELAQRYPFIVFVPKDQEAHAKGATFWDEAARFRLNEVRRLSPNVLPEVTRSFHEALDSYVKAVRLEYTEPTPDGPTPTSFAAAVEANVTTLKARHQDIPLSQLDEDGCRALLDYWRNRPQTVDKRIKPPRPLAVKTCQNIIAEIKRFLKWLHKSKEYSWRKPDDFDELKSRVKELQEERTSIVDYTQRRFYLPDELVTLNKYATPLERLLLLLGLNCGMKGAEQGTLLPDHVFLDSIHPNADYLHQVCEFECTASDSFIIYSRNKTKVYGEFLLWEQTEEILRWAMNRRERIVEQLDVPHRNLLITKEGALFHRLTKGEKNRSQIFSNKWSALLDRIQKDRPDFNRFPFSSLRDSASDLIRQVSDGEVAAVFLMHGKPVKKDDLLDLYTKRPFGKVFEALRKVEGKLKPMFDAAPENVTEQPVQQYTPLGKQERIVELKKQGKKVPEIAAEVGVSKGTVTRTITRLYYKMSSK